MTPVYFGCPRLAYSGVEDQYRTRSSCLAHTVRNSVGRIDSLISLRGIHSLTVHAVQVGNHVLHIACNMESRVYLQGIEVMLP